MTSREISNCLGDHHKAYYILHVIQKYMHYYMCHMDIGENFGSVTNRIIFVIRSTVVVPGVCLCNCICTMMHNVHTGEAVVTSD